MTDYRKKLVVPPGEKVKLKHFDPDAHGKFEDEAAAKAEMEKYLAQITELQGLMYGENKHSLLVVLQGLDTAGKDGVVKHVFTAMNPQGCHMVSFKEPTREELAHDFLWRIHPHVPRKGSVAIFNRSHYEDVIVTKVHKLFPKEILSARYDRINEFEQLLATENNTTVMKFFLHISKEEQLERFKDRLDDRSRHWKIADSDYSERKYWEDYADAYETVLRKTSTEHAPWYIIPSNKKWFRNLAISQIISKTMEDLGMKEPAPTVDISKIKKQYEKAVLEAKESK